MFVGNFRHTPNLDAVMFFVRNIYPEIRRANRSVRLTIAGANPPPQITYLEHDPSIEVTGYVDDLGPLYRRSGCVVTPITWGSGTRIKLLEAMASGTPVVSTRVGAEGLALRHGEHLLLADDPISFARQVQKVLCDPTLAMNLSRNARRLVESRYDWDVVAQDTCRIYDNLMEGRI